MLNLNNSGQLSNLQSAPNLIAAQWPILLSNVDEPHFSVGTRWREAWDHSQVTNHSLIADQTAHVPGFDLHDASGSC